MDRHVWQFRAARLAALCLLAAGVVAGVGARRATLAAAPDSGMVLVRAGYFTMGSNHGRDNEKPPRRVYLPAFYIDRHEVTNQQYADFVNATGKTRDASGRRLFYADGMGLYLVDGVWRPRPGLARHPAVGVTWYGAMAYGQWAGKRLPTEAEWEKAARGGDGRAYPWGNRWDPRRCNNPQTSPKTGAKTRTVGSFPTGASPYGCLDMAGNVWEWTSSLYRPYPYRSGDGRESRIAAGERVARGGSFFSYSTGDFRCASRRNFGPGNRHNFLGFRCVRSSTGR